MKKEKNSNYTWVIIAVLFLIIIAIAPMVINKMYFRGAKLQNPNTYFHANDLLAYCGSVISALGSIALGAVAIKQNINANKLNKEFLAIEQEKNMPPISIREVLEEPPVNALQKSYKVSIGEEAYYQFDSNNNQINGTSTPVCLLLKNVGEHTIISFRLESIRFISRYDNGNSYTMPQDVYSVSLSNNVLLPNEEIYILLSDVPHYSPKELSIEEMFNQNYTGRIDELTMTFHLVNNAGRAYKEIIDVHLSFVCGLEGDVYYPVVIVSRIEKLELI